MLIKQKIATVATAKTGALYLKLQLTQITAIF